MNEDQIRKKLREAFAEAEGKPPSFDGLWMRAEAQQARSMRRVRAIGGIAAAAAVLVVTAVLWPTRDAELNGEYLIADALLNSTSWTAPSDALMPDHQFDIYQEVPFLFESTISQEGPLL